jgi:hypothetical protein
MSSKLKFFTKHHTCAIDRVDLDNVSIVQNELDNVSNTSYFSDPETNV